MIISIFTGNRYIGSTKTPFYKRIQGHRNSLRYSTHENKNLQKEFNLFGFEGLVWVVLERTEHKTTREQFWLDSIKPELNVSKFADSTKEIKHPPKTQNQIESILRVSQLPRTEKFRAALVERNKARIWTEDSRRQASLGARKRKKPVVATCKKTGTQIKFPSISEAAKILKLSDSGLRQTIRGKKRKSLGGYTFKLEAA